MFYIHCMTGWINERLNSAKIAKRAEGRRGRCRANEADDVMLSKGEIKQLALDIEGELFKLHGGVTQRYKSKYRSLVFNIKDPKNTVSSAGATVPSFLIDN